MDYGGVNDDLRRSYSSDFVQWQGSQIACAALDSLLSEAALTSQSESLQRPKGFAKKASRDQLHDSLPGHTSTLLSSSRPPTNVTASHLSALNGLSAASNCSNPSNNHRTRQTRPSTPSTTDASPVGDPDQFLSMLKGISQRIDNNIRNDTSTPRDNLRRRAPSKRIASSSSAANRRARHDVPQKSSPWSASEGFDKGKGREVRTWTRTSTDTVHLAGDSFRRPKSRNDRLGSIISDAMEVDPPSPSCEIMPPPPIPPLQANPSAIATYMATQQDTRCTPSPGLPTVLSSQGTKDHGAPLPLYLPSRSKLPSKPPSQTKDPPILALTAPSSTLKLHPLLEDNKRKQRRLKLERTISASLASLPSDSAPTFDSPSQAISPAQIPQQPLRPQSNYPPSLSLSQNRVVNASRPPPLGMRRTNTFPLHDRATSGLEPPPLKQRSFRPPLLSSPQPPSTPSATSSRTTVPSSHTSERSSASSYTSPATSTDTPESKSNDEDPEDLPLNSDADTSFGDAIALGVDMDALEETMRKYD